MMDVLARMESGARLPRFEWDANTEHIVSDQTSGIILERVTGGEGRFVTKPKR